MTSRQPLRSPILSLVLFCIVSGCGNDDGPTPPGPGGEDPPAGARAGHLDDGSSFDFSTGTADPSGRTGDFQYLRYNMIGLVAPNGVSWWTGEGLQDFVAWISNPTFLPPPDAYVRDSRADGSSGRHTRWLKTDEGRYAMLFSVAVRGDGFDFYYVYPYGDFAWSDREAPEPCLLISVSPTASPGELRVEWQHSPSPDVAGYKIAYGPSIERRTEILTGYFTTHLLSGLESGRLYYVWVRAYDGEGNTSDFVEPMTGTPR